MILFSLIKTNPLIGEKRFDNSNSASVPKDPQKSFPFKTHNLIQFIIL